MIWYDFLPGWNALLHHSNRGSEYNSEPFRRVMADHRVSAA
jgi:transposase InsO family protein